MSYTTERLHNVTSFADELPVAVIIHRTDTMKIIYMNKYGLDELGSTSEELQSLTEEEYYAKYFNPDDSSYQVPKIMQIIRSDSKEKASYFQRVRTHKQEWQLYVSNTKVFARNENGEATHLITVASMLDPEHHVTDKVTRLMEEVSFLRHNNSLFVKLTAREKEVLRCMAMGLNSGEIAKKLFISSTTADTHRRNIRNKLALKNNYDAVKFAQAYNLI